MPNPPTEVQAENGTGNDRLRDAAERLHAFGRTPLPLVDKEPMVRWKRYQTDRPDRKTVSRVFRDPRVNGLAVLHDGDLVARDWDTTEAYVRWRDRYPALADTLPTCRTGRGYRAYVQWPNVGYRKFGDGEVIAGPKHYSVVPPSRHPNGTSYTWTVGCWAGESLPAINPAEAGFYPDPSASCANVIHQAHQAHQIHQAQQTHQIDQSDQCVDTMPVMHDAVDAAIGRTLPNDAGQRNRKVFELMKEMRALGFRKAKDCKRHVQTWWELAHDVIGTKDWSETWTDFVVAWDRFDPDRGGIGEALARAAQVPPPPEVCEYGERLRRLASLCRELQRAAGDKQFFLSCQSAADALGVDPTQSHRDLKVLQADELLVMVRKGTYRAPDGHRQATEWRWRGAL